MEHDDLSLAVWKEHGGNLAIWGRIGIPLCACKIMEFTSWFRNALATDSPAATEFVSFRARLRKE